MSQTALDTFSMTKRAEDPRADGGTRIVHVSAKQIVIERVLQKVRMKVAVPVAGYQCLVIAVRLQAAKATLRLAHEDPELDVTLASGDAIDVAKTAKAWGALFGKPITIEEVCVTMFTPFARQRRSAKPARRSSFAKRRRVGQTARLKTSFDGEREIIARD